MWSAWISLCLFLLAGTARCADPPKPAPTPTLADALKAARPPRTGFILCVGAERVSLPPKTTMPDAGAAWDDVADAFGRQTLTFGAVTALAPPTMTVLNTQPTRPNIYADLRPQAAFQMLAASLNDVQWAALTSKEGVGQSDLSTDDQRDLFHALFPEDKLRVASQDPALQKLDDDKRPDVRDVSDQIDGVRLRLGQTAKIYLHDATGATIFYSGTRPDVASGIVIFTGKRKAKSAAHGVTLRAVVPNMPKDGNLSFRLPALQTPVIVTKLKTVSELIDRVRSQTGVEIYADPHYAAKSVTVLGSAASARARDVLQALALCVCGTYRKVGPAFMLTDDVDGVGARRQRLTEWRDLASASLNRLTDPAGLSLLTRRAASARTLSGFGDPLALTPAQLKAVPPDMSIPEIPGGFIESKVAFRDLTPAQQDYAARIAADYNADPQAGEGEKNVPALSGTVDFSPNTVVQILVPGISSPVKTSFTYGDMMMLYWPGEPFLMASIVDKVQAAKAKAAPKDTPPPLASLLARGKRHALLGHPRTAADVDALLLAMQKLGLNELYLDVFSGGEAHVPGFAVSPPTGNDVLSEALTLGPKRGIAIYADMSLLHWGDAPPAGTADLTIEGETSAEAAAAAHRRDPSPKYDDMGKPVAFAVPPVTVSPLSPVVCDDLAALVRAVAARPGLAGFVWEDAEMGDALGYTNAARLEFLRAAHADPVDLTPQNYVQFDVSLPEWDNSNAEDTLSAQWHDARQNDIDRLLTVLRRAVPFALPILRPDVDDGTEFMAEWRTDRVRLPMLLRVRSDDPDTLAQRMTFGWKKQVWQGYVLNMTDDNATRGPSPLADLMAAVKAAPRK